MPAKKKAAKKVHPVQTPGGYIVTGLIMWVVGYMLAILAIDSGSLLQWLGVLIAFGWGLVRIVEGTYQFFMKKPLTKK
jgi:uncharacterized membrane protein